MQYKSMLRFLAPSLSLIVVHGLCPQSHAQSAPPQQNGLGSIPSQFSHFRLPSFSNSGGSPQQEQSPAPSNNGTIVNRANDSIRLAQQYEAHGDLQEAAQKYIEVCRALVSTDPVRTRQCAEEAARVLFEEIKNLNCGSANQTELTAAGDLLKGPAQYLLHLEPNNCQWLYLNGLADISYDPNRRLQSALSFFRAAAAAPDGPSEYRDAARATMQTLETRMAGGSDASGNHFRAPRIQHGYNGPSEAPLSPAASLGAAALTAGVLSGALGGSDGRGPLGALGAFNPAGNWFGGGFMRAMQP